MNANALAAVAFKTTLLSSTRAPPAADAMQPIELPSMGTYDSEEDDDDDAAMPIRGVAPPDAQQREGEAAKVASPNEFKHLLMMMCQMTCRERRMTTTSRCTLSPLCQGRRRRARPCRRRRGSRSDPAAGDGIGQGRRELEAKARAEADEFLAMSMARSEAEAATRLQLFVADSRSAAPTRHSRALRRCRPTRRAAGSTPDGRGSSNSSDSNRPHR